MAEAPRRSAGGFCPTRIPTLNGGPPKSPPTPQPLRITLERPTRSLRMLLRQGRLTLEKQKPSAPIVGLTVTIPVAAALHVEQLPLDDHLSSAAQADLPPDSTAILTPVRHNLDLPEERLRFEATDLPREPAATVALPHWSHHRHYSAATGSLRLCRPARSIEVTFENDQPIAVRQTRVESDGPWELSGGWWNRDYDRHYWEIRDRLRRRFLIYHDRLSRCWFLQGIYD